ncbi:PTS mannose/fructose/sorbose/N-acetylgalactosamine transporter subunit IIC [Abyssisolibacter fermentans]|uniref:PTS mannose/fructose/sorbose/N-acetylgalactosamine transporter subunit IIC n=1 Tax=Abyssisolibacter fermentans TaxID=1766203 RepID=UPI000834290E|nr:PTS sugar transporter subunit IIC [Abyssisolibacter fermentans]
MSLLLTSIIVALITTICFIDSHTFQTHIFRPIFIGPLVGLVMGDLTTGLIVGATIELMFLAVIFVGTANPLDPTISTAIAVAFAVLGGGGTELAIATALPVALIGQIVTTIQNTTINVWFMHRAEKCIEKLDVKGLVRNNTIWPMAMNAILYGLPTFLAIYFGAEYVLNIIDAIPPKMIQGLAAGGGLIGGVGFALLLKSIKSTHLWPFFFVGFFFASYLQINLIGIGILAFICTSLYYYLVVKKDAERESKGAA